MNNALLNTSIHDKLEFLAQDIGKKINSRLFNNQEPIFHLSSIEDSFLVEFLHPETKILMRMIHIYIGPKIQINGVMDGVTCEAIEGIHTDHEPGSFEYSVYLPNANHFIKLLMMFEDETETTLQIKEPYEA